MSTIGEEYLSHCVHQLNINAILIKIKKSQQQWMEACFCYGEQKKKRKSKE